MGHLISKEMKSGWLGCEVTLEMFHNMDTNKMH